MFRPNPSKNKSSSILYFLISAGMVAVAAPKLRENTLGLHGVFQMVWLVFAMVVMAANLWFILGVSPKKEPMRVRETKKLEAYQSTNSAKKQSGRKKRMDV